MAGADARKTVFYALGANTAIAAAKLAAAVITGSSAMLAEGIHSVADAGNQLLLLLGLRQSRRPPDEHHPLGYGKSIYFWSFIVAIILFSVGGMFSLTEGLHKLQNPHALSWPWLAVGVLIFAVIAEGISLRAAMVEINKVRGERSYWRWFRDSRQSVLIVIFGEDLAALLGLLFALAAVLLTIATGNPVFDAVGTLMIGALLIVVALLIGIEVKALLVGESIDPQEITRMRAFVAGQQSVDELLNMITLQLGTDVMVAVKLKMASFANQEMMIGAIDAFEVEFRHAFPSVVWLFVEPDLDD